MLKHDTRRTFTGNATPMNDGSHTDTPPPMVSVCMLTYNHGAYVAQAIEGVLAQQTGFSCELVIGDDGSTDNTQSVCERFAAENPGRIVCVMRPKNLGAMANFRDIYARCRGRYLALCEGDDYWTDPRKLARQVAAMEQNPAWSGCCHRAEAVSETGPRVIFPTGPMPAELTFEALSGGNKMHTCSVMYRRGLVPSIPIWFDTLPMGDWPLHLLHAAQGPIGFLDEVMSVYRVHSGGMWSGLSETERIDLTLKAMFTLEAHMPAPFNGILARQRHETIDSWRGASEHARKIEARYRALGLHHLAAAGKWCKDLLRNRS